MSWWMMKNSAGEPCAMLTLAVASWAITSVLLISSVIKSLSIGKFGLELNAPDATLLLGYLGATFGAYVMRRNKKDHLAHEEAKAEMQNGILPGSGE